jgi:hypothetical protein
MLEKKLMRESYIAEEPAASASSQVLTLFTFRISMKEVILKNCSEGLM